MGDGINDTQILEKCMFGIAPANARVEAKNCAYKSPDPKKQARAPVLPFTLSQDLRSGHVPINSE